EVIRTIHDRGTGAQDSLLRQVDESIAARVRPAKEMELHLARFVFENEWALVESLFGRLGGREVQLGNILSAFGSGLPARRLVTLHLFNHAFVRESGCAGLRPDGGSVSMIAVMVGVEDIFH